MARHPVTWVPGLLAPLYPADVSGCPGLIAGDGMALQFRHEIARLAVEGAVAAHRRTAIHARALASLQALGCDDDARMAFHAEAAGDGPAALRHASAAARRAAGLASHREAAAQFERALRFTNGADPATVAGLYDGFAYEASLLDHGVIDSTGVLEVIAFIERRFEIRVDDEEILPENLDSVARISAYVQRKRG